MREGSEAILCRVLDSMANGVIAIDREGAITIFNDATARQKWCRGAKILEIYEGIKEAEIMNVGRMLMAK